jgi:hypothetical protein
MIPVGALEIGPTGTHFVPIRPLAPLIGAAVAGLVFGLLLGRTRKRRT